MTKMIDPIESGAINFIHMLTAPGSERTVCSLRRDIGIMVTTWPKIASCPKCAVHEEWRTDTKIEKPAQNVR